VFENNGILAQVPGEFIAAGTEQLPPPGPDQQEQPTRATVVQGVRDLGAVRITYELKSYRRGKSRAWHWAALRADLEP
jgi:hypothetical protein